MEFKRSKSQEVRLPTLLKLRQLEETFGWDAVLFLLRIKNLTQKQLQIHSPKYLPWYFESL
jgi:hypothetical protein